MSCSPTWYWLLICLVVFYRLPLVKGNTLLPVCPTPSTSTLLSHHVHKWWARVCRVLQRVLTQRPDPPGPPLQPHLLRPLLGENGQAGRRHPHRLLPSVPLDYLHTIQPDPARVPMGQHGYLGPDYRRAEEEERLGEELELRKDPTHQFTTVSVLPNRS